MLLLLQILQNRRSLRLLGLLAAVAALGVWFSSTSTLARGPVAFDGGSLRGTYALVGIGGANEAGSVGVTKFDGGGRASRTLVLNEADPAGSGRLIVTIPATGNYVVNPDGTGAAVFLNELPDGSRIPFNFDFVITEAQVAGGRGQLLGTKVHMIQREPGIAAKLVVFDLTRLPDQSFGSRN